MSSSTSAGQEDAGAPVVSQTVEVPAGRSTRASPHEAPKALTKEKGQRRLRSHKMLLDSEDAEEHTENTNQQRRMSLKGGGLVSESEDAEESRVEVSYRPSQIIDESGEEYSYIGGGGGWSRTSEAAARAMPGAKELGRTPRGDDLQSEEISASESLVDFRPKTASLRRYGKEFEESTDAESASESELPFKDDDKIPQK